MKRAENSVAESRREPLAWYYGLYFGLACALLAEVFLMGTLPQMTIGGTAGRVTISTISLYLIHRCVLFCFRGYRPQPRDLAAVAGVLVLTLGVFGIGRVLGASLASYFSAEKISFGVHAHSFDFAIPLALAALLIQAVLGARFALVTTLSLACIVGLYSPFHPLAFPSVLTSGCVVSLVLPSFRSRSAYLRAGLQLAVVALPFAIASLFFESAVTPADAVIRLLGALVGGLLAAILAAGFIPLVEYIGGYVTDLRLIEMATLDHPLLKDLSIQCPGTWNHSMVMGMMVEAAASEIGANPVLSRVGAYFHDVGKTKKPLYFIENQAGGENRHEKLSSSMSALIIRSHVKDGIELARRHKLPQKIEDMIPEHHGTSRIEFFYDKACREAEEAGSDPASVDANLYSYPGPRPQTKEAGILMLADGIEAASRTLSDPSSDRMQGLVQKMINKVFASGELDECDLTLSDLHAIAKAFTRVLSGIYHQRIAYAEPAEKTNERDDNNSEQSSDVESRSQSKVRRAGAEERAVKEEAKEDLKRLGL